MIFEFTECEELLGYKFKDSSLFVQCFTHSSYTNENFGAKNNERLEFFGDKIIDFTVTEYLYEKYPTEDEGKLTERRKNLVSKGPLTRATFRLNIDKFILLGNGILNDRDPDEKFYSSLYEAVVAGIYLDGGLEKAKKFILKTLVFEEEKLQKSNKKATKSPDKDYKTALQEFMQKHKMGAPKYQSVSKTGPDNDPVFTECVIIGGTVVANGSGGSKKKAQQDSAKKVYEQLVKNGAKFFEKKVEKKKTINAKKDKEVLPKKTGKTR